jgi:hypothetical protein
VSGAARGGAAAGRGTSAGARSRSGGSARPATRAERIRRREQRLRETVTRRQACLGDLTRPERRVLVLRAGVGAGPPLSRTRVARRLDFSRARVARLERAGLRRLRGTCTGTAPSAGASEPVAGRPGDLVAAVDTSGEGGAGSAGSGGSTGSAGAQRGSAGGGSAGGGSAGGDSAGGDSSGGSRGGVEGVSATHAPSSGGGIDLAIPLILVALALAAWALTRVLRGREGAPAAAGPEEPARVPWRPRLRSNMQGPGWTEHPPGDTGDPSRWTPGAEPPPAAPEPEPPPESWAGQPPRRVSRRR